MTSKEIADMIYNFKDKLTDKEFKDIMDKLSIKNKEEQEEQEDIYVVRYIKQKPILSYDGDGDLYYKFSTKYKIRKVKLNNNRISFKEMIDGLVREFRSGVSYSIPHLDIIKKDGEYFLENRDFELLNWYNNPHINNCRCLNCENGDDDKSKERGVFINYYKSLILDIRKI